MNFLLITITIFSLQIFFDPVQGHGMLMDPIGRSSRWRIQPGAPANYDDNGLNCGGYGTQMGSDGNCGICGDSVHDKKPRANELGGKYGEGVIVKTYTSSTIWIAPLITANHLGYYYIDICNLDEFKYESDECFAKNGPLMLIEGDNKLFIGSQTGYINTSAIIPPNLKCNHCVLRWSYVAGNNWGSCKDGSGALGCGSQETFRSCADISIV